MSLFNKVFTGTEADEEAPAIEQPVLDESSTTDHQVESSEIKPDSPFAAFVKEAVRFGATSEATPASVEEMSEKGDVEVDEEVDNSDELDEDDESEEDEDDEDDSSDEDDDEDDEDDDEDDEDDEDSSEVAEAEASVAPMADAAPTPPAAESTAQKIEESVPVAQAPAPLAPRVEPPALPVPVKTQQKKQKKQPRQPASQEEQARLIIEGLFDKMRGAWEKEQSPSASALAAQKLEAQRRAEQLLQLEQHALTESKAEITKMLSTHIPRVVEGKLLASIKTEVTKAVRSAVSKALHDEFESIERAMSKQLERLHAIEARMSKIEGAVEKEVKINFPKGAIQVDSPITVQPPSVTFSEGAISAHFTKTGGGNKEVRFERDPHDQSIKSAAIIDAPSE